MRILTIRRKNRDACGANQVDVIITGPEFRTPWFLLGVAVVGSDLEYEAKCYFQVTSDLTTSQ